MDEVEVGDHVRTTSGAIHWIVIEIEDKIDPLGVILRSGMSERRRRDTYANLIVFRKGTK